MSLPTTSPLSIPLQHHKHHSLPDHKTISLASHRSHNLYYHPHIRHPQRPCRAPLLPSVRHPTPPPPLRSATQRRLPLPTQPNSNLSSPDSHPLPPLVTYYLLLKNKGPGREGVPELRGVGTRERRGGGDSLFKCCWGAART